jgi:2-polyprenyl-3-methyl-5-hydroxy-6-metoxy-1,4-benzoquinol methylase
VSERVPGGLGVPSAARQYTGAPQGSHAYLSQPIRELCARFAPVGGSILDVGCGNGWLARDLADFGFAVTGIEPSESGVRCARELVPDATFLHLGVYDELSGLPDEGFDAVVSAEVIEHLFAPRALIRVSWDKLKPGGALVITTPYHGFAKNLAISLKNGWDSHHQPGHDGGHIKFFSRRTLQALLEERGFEVVQFLGVGRVRWLWKSMILVAKKPAHG